MPAASESQSLEAALMDWSDDVAYAVHDMEDFYRAGLIPLDRLASDHLERARFLEEETNRLSGRFNANDLEDAFSFVMNLSPILEPYRGTREDRARVRSFTSGLIERYVNAVSLNPAGDFRVPLVIDQAAILEVTILKSLTWHYVIASRSLTAQRFGQRALVRSLFTILCDAANSPDDWHIFPEFYQGMLARAHGDRERIVRAVADVIAAMAETQLVELHQRITGTTLGSAMDPIIV